MSTARGLTCSRGLRAAKRLTDLSVLAQNSGICILTYAMLSRSHALIVRARWWLPLHRD